MLLLTPLLHEIKSKIHRDGSTRDDGAPGRMLAQQSCPEI